MTATAVPADIPKRTRPPAGNAGGGSGQDEHRGRGPVPAWRPAVLRRDRDQEQGDQKTDG